MNKITATLGLTAVLLGFSGCACERAPEARYCFGNLGKINKISEVQVSEIYHTDIPFPYYGNGYNIDLGNGVVRLPPILTVIPKGQEPELLPVY